MIPLSAKEKSKRRRRRGTWIGALFVGMLCLLSLDYYAFPYGKPITAPEQNRGENGLWLRYTWYFGQHTDAEVKDLARQLKARQIRDAYFHVRGVTEAGRLNYRYSRQAQHLLTTLRRETPEIRCIAWIYVGNKRGQGKVDLSRPQVRKTMAAEALWLVKQCGFDGVQWDYEICDDGDADFLRLLQETRAALPPGKLLSVATPMWLPGPLRAWGWSDAYFSRVAAHSDQIAVMCYDSGFVWPRSYVWLLRQQPLHVTQAVIHGDPHCRILFGVPTYGGGFRSHNPRAENLRLALRGIREGLVEPGVALSVFAGIAPFADYTTDDRDWRTYNRDWLGSD